MLFHTLTRGLGLCLVFLFFAASSHAAGISGKKNLICASGHVVACTEGVCLEGTPATFDVPTFLFVDAKRKVVHGVDQEGNEATSPITGSDVTEQAYVLQGIENHRGWTMGIDRSDGQLTLSSTGADVSFMIMGNCTER